MRVRLGVMLISRVYSWRSANTSVIMLSIAWSRSLATRNADGTFTLATTGWGDSVVQGETAGISAND